MKIKQSILNCISKVLGVRFFPDVTQKEYELLLRIRKSKPQYVLLTEEDQIKKWNSIDIQKQKKEDNETNNVQQNEMPLTFIAYNNLIRTLYRALDDAKLLSEGQGKEYVVSDIMKSFKNCGLEIVNYDGLNKDLFEIKEDCECREPEIGTPTLREIKTGKIIIKGVLFVPENK